MANKLLLAVVLIAALLATQERSHLVAIRVNFKDLFEFEIVQQPKPEQQEKR